MAGRRERHSRHGPPILIGDDEVSFGGTGNIPGAVDFFHSAIFSNDSSVVNWVDESFAPTTGSDDCLPTTDLAARAWHPAGTHKTGRMFFSDLATGAFLSEFQVGDLRPEPGAYCSAHMGVATGQLNAHARPWVRGRPAPSPRYRRRVLTYRILRNGALLRFWSRGDTASAP